MEKQTIIAANRKEIPESVLFRAKTEYVDPENKKILGVTARATIVGYETVSGAIKVNVKTVFRLLFRNGEGVFSHETAETEQTETIPGAFVTPTSFVCMDATVTNVSRMGNALQATILISGWYVVEKNVALLNSCIPDVHCKTVPFKAENVVGMCPGGLSLTYTDESRTNVETLLDYCPEVNITNVFSGTGSYRIEGEIFLRILAQGEDGQCFSQLFIHNFSTEISDERVTPSSEIDVEATVKSADLSLADGDKRLLITDVTLSFCGTLGETVETETICDAYSETNELTIKSEKTTLTEGFCLRSLREKITNKVAPENGVNEMFGVLSPNITVSFVPNNGSASVEGVIEADVLYQNEKDEVVAQKTETPFRISLPMDYRCDSKMQPKIIVTGCNAKARGGEIDLTFETTITVKGVATRIVQVVSDIEPGAKKATSDYAVGLYIVQKGESLWDVAKALNVSEDVLLTQNTDVPLPLTGGERIVLFRGLTFDK